GAIADSIVSQNRRVVLVAGPSSAGKTTFAKRLAVQLRVNGVRPRTISTDDYFRDEAHTPRDADGNPDFEHIEAVDVILFNQHLIKLLAGEEIEQVKFDFETKKREVVGTGVRLEDDELLIVEGIHGLNPRLTYMVPVRKKFRIYVSALTQLAIDSNNRISTTDNRLMRRMVRDKRFRGNSPLRTLRMWPSVRSGEKTWVFPFQREADAAFNSALDYELAVLKPLVEPLLLEVKPSDPEYAEARRLSAFLSNFLGMPDFDVPRTSILREYIGRSGFRY
ncbi:MAG: nucleoside kinase, partial [bacterium]